MAARKRNILAVSPDVIAELRRRFPGTVSSIPAADLVDAHRTAMNIGAVGGREEVIAALEAMNLEDAEDGN